MSRPNVIVNYEHLLLSEYDSCCFNGNMLALFDLHEIEKETMQSLTANVKRADRAN